ncbi:MAG: AAA family ATPase, partial [bacterium]
MIEKIIYIKNVGRLRDYNYRGDVAFRKLNLIFADNGRGKTTLCAVLRSLQSGQAEPIQERSTLGVKDPPSVQIMAGGKKHSFSKSAWSASFQDIAIFDSVFIHDNVFAGDYVDSEHKKNLYKVIVGAQGVSLARQIESLDGQIKDANTKIAEKKESLSKVVPKGITIDTFIGIQQVQYVDIKIKAKKEEIQAKQKTAEKANEIKSKGSFVKVSLPKFPANFLSVLKQEITDVIADAESKVRKHIADHKMAKQGEAWLSQGLPYVHDGKCPFCGLSVDQNDLIAAYRSHFNKAYESLKSLIAQLPSQVEAAIGPASLKSLENAVSGNLVLVEFWKQLFEINIPIFPLNEVLEKFDELKKVAFSLAQKKQESLIASMQPEPGFFNLISLIDGFQNSVDSYKFKIGSDSITSTVKRPVSYTFTKAGEYDVTEIISSRGCIDTSMNIRIVAGDKLTPDFTIAPGEVCNDGIVHLTGDTGNNLLVNTWRFRSPDLFDISFSSRPDSDIVVYTDTP